MRMPCPAMISDGRSVQELGQASATKAVSIYVVSVQSPVTPLVWEEERERGTDLLEGQRPTSADMEVSEP